MNKVAQNAIWIIACKIAQSLLSFVIGMLSARYLGPSNYGLINYAASLVGFFAPIASLGFGDVLVREIVDAPNREGEKLGTAMLLSALSGVACVVGVITFAAVANPNEPTTVLVCAIYSLKLILQNFNLINYWFQAKLLSKYSSLISLAAYVLISGYRVFLLITQKNVYWFAATASLDILLIGFASLFIYNRVGTQSLKFSGKTGKEIFLKSRHYIVSTMMVAIFAQTDKVMLKAMLSETATGYYSAAIACIGATNFIYPAIIDSFRPPIFEAHNLDKEMFKRRLAMLYCIIIYLSLAQSLVMSIFAPFIIRIIYGIAYAPAQSALRLAVWFTTFSYLGAVRNIWILANNQQRHLWKINLSGAAANVLLNAVLIPHMGINGAALASIVTQFFTNVVTGYILAPIRENNRIMISGCNPKYLREAFIILWKTRMKYTK
jgi:O-antigen/teichoic acid export membrane protein